MSLASFSWIRETISTIFSDDWDENEFPVAYPNIEFTQPQSAWVRFSIALADRSSAALGDAMARQMGVVYLQCFQPEGSGTKNIYEAADAFSEILRNKQFTIDGNTIAFQDVILAGPFNTGSFSQLTASISFRVDSYPDPV